jgi:prepilin signal peptidase PulO-like enzyme (type II secretory pathway)
MSEVSTIMTGMGVASLIVLLSGIAFHDLRSMIIPNRLNMLLLTIGLAFALVLPQPGWWSAISGVLAGASVLGGLATIFRAWRGETGLGLGDVKFVASAGAWVGWSGLPPLVLLASSSALLFIGMRRCTVPSYNMRARLPFGPFLAASTLTIWVLQTRGLAFW